ncbi:MAG TPA: type II toxin-antitoxin system Phd/YefM family antitoxin [bacterium]|nr:type II toxin-antitoxin system Phd/YefM family antitoxin [bacterium]HPN43735.1 type II toxin-antitoxin system Phd/YefM family antitoxin [bacterium]
MKSVSVTNAKANLTQLVDEIALSREPVLITGKYKHAILIVEEEWLSIQETLYLLSIPGMRESIKNGIDTPIIECSGKPGW